MTFQQLTCGDRNLDGTASLTYDLTSEAVSLTGQWDLSGSNGGKSVTTSGDGTATYDKTAKATTISSFTGTASDGTDTYDVTATDVTVSYQQNENLIPSAGEVTASRTGGHTVTVRFNADSPTTGDIEISVNGGPFVTVNISEL